MSLLSFCLKVHTPTPARLCEPAGSNNLFSIFFVRLLPSVLMVTPSTGCTLMLSGLLISTVCFAQETHHYTIPSGQPAPLVADAGDDVIFGSDEVIQLGATPAASGGIEPYIYAWTPSENLSDPGTATPTVTSADEDITYTLTVIDGAGCQSTDVVTVFSGIITSVPSGQEIPFTIQASHGGITIRASSSEGTVQLLDGRGSTIRTDRLLPVEHHLPTTSLATGIYVLRISIDRHVHTVKFFVR